MGATAKHVGVQQGAIAAQTSRRLPEQQAKTAEHPLLQLQRAFGNQAVQRGLSSGRFGSFVLQRKCASCEDEEQKKMQTKLAIRAPGDVYEQEADRVAEAVMSGGVQSSAVKPMAVSGGMQRCSCSAGAPQCDQCKAESAKGQPGFSEPAGSAAPPAVSEVLSAPGETLQRSARENMEERFGGHDFSGVRVHTDARAVESAQAVNALAYTVGNHVVFGAGQYAPSSRAGQHLLAHELTHVLQQRGSSGPSMQSKLAIGAANDPAEHEAELTATALADRPSLDAGPVQVTHTGPGLRRARYTTPQGANDVRVAHQNLPDKGKRYVMRYIAICPCRRVDDPQSGVFANPDLDDLVLVYRRCSGHHTWDYFGRLQSDASTALQTPSVPQGTLRGGVTGHITGTGTSGRVDVNVLGGNEVAGGQLGGQAAGVLEHKGWTFSLSAEYRRNLQPSPGTPSDQVLGQTALCPPGWPFCITASGTVGDPQLGTSVTGGIRSRTAPPISRDTCITCIC